MAYETQSILRSLLAAALVAASYEEVIFRIKSYCDEETIAVAEKLAAQEIARRKAQQQV